MNMKQTNIAKENRVSDAFISDVKHGKRKTKSFEIAKELEKLTGKSYLNYLSPKIAVEILLEKGVKIESDVF